MNAVLLRWAKQFNVPVIASNDSHYVDQQDANAHDILLCINTGEKQSTPRPGLRRRDGQAQGHPLRLLQRRVLLQDAGRDGGHVQRRARALDNTNAIVDKVEVLKLKQDILLPHYAIPEGFTDQDEYLTHLTYQGAVQRYLNGDGGVDSLEPRIEERLD